MKLALSETPKKGFVAPRPICKGPKYRFSVQIDFKSCREEIAGALQEFCNRWCKREHVESNALNSWKLNIFKIIDGRISFYCNNLDLLPP